MGELRVTQVAGYVEGAEEPRLSVTQVIGYVEVKAQPELRVTQVAGYIELLYRPVQYRTAALSPFVVRRQYLSLLYVKRPGETWTLVDQGRLATPTVEYGMDQAARLGGYEMQAAPAHPVHHLTVELYADSDLDEVSRILGFEHDGGWAGNEQITLDSERVVDWKIENYDGVEGSSALLFVEYINHFRPSSLEMALAVDDVRMAVFNGVADAYYIMPEAGL